MATALVLFTSSAWAQTAGTLTGTILDEDELEVPGVEVTLSSPDMIGGAQVQITDGAGRFRFTALLPGVYKLRAVSAGFNPVTVEGISVLANRTTTQNVVLQYGGGEEVIEVTGEKLIDTESTSVGTVLTKDFLQRIPTGRSYQDAVQLSAGVTGGSNPNMAGGASNENTYLLDGATVTDPVTGTFGNNFNFDAIQQIEVLLGGYDPEYGVSLGGVINLVTDSGTNNLEFDTSVFYQNGDWRPRMDARFTSDGYELAPSGFDDTFSVIQVNARVSGPLVQDKAWFVFSYSYNRSLIALTGIPQRRDFDGHYLLAKLTIQPNSSHRISLLFQTDPTSIDNISQGNPYQKAEAQGRQSQAGFVGQATWQWFLNQDMNLEARVQVQKISLEQYSVPCSHDRSRDVHQCRPGEEEGEIDFETPGRIGQFGAYDSVAYGIFVFDDRWRFQGSLKYSLVGLTDSLGGTHDVKIGLSTDQTLRDSVQGYAGNSLFIDVNESGFDPETFTNYYWLEVSGPFASRSSGSVWSAFIQDAYKPVSNVTVRYGLRFDNSVIRNDLGEPVISGNLFGPRLYASWDPWGDQKTKIAGGYGRFNETGRQAVAGFTSVGAFGSKLFLGEFFSSSGVGFTNATGEMYDLAPRTNLNAAADQLVLPSVDEFNIIVQRQIVNDVAIGANFQARFTRNLYAADDVGTIYDEDGSAVIGSRTADPLNQYLRLRTPRLAHRNYYRLDGTLTKRASKRWGGQLTYSYTWINGTTNASLQGDFVNDPQTQYNYGRLLTAREHSLNGYVYWDIPNDPWTTTIAAVLQYDSGAPLERLYWTDAGGGGGYGLRIRQRGQYWQWNDLWEIGLRIQQAFDVRRGKLILDLQAENAFNFRAPDNFTTAIYTENRLIAISRQDPLRFQVGIRYQY